MEREVSEVDRKLLLKKTYLDKIHYYITRNPIDQEELYSTIRKFFSEYLKLDYEFTYEELSQELNKVFIKPKVKEHVDDFLIRLSESEYLEEKALGTLEINGFLRELDDIIRNLIFDDQPIVLEENPTLIQKVLKIKHKDSEKVMDITSVSTLIDEINFHITNGNLDIAKNSYIELLKTYDVLNRDDKRKLHDDMNEVYERLQTLIKNPKFAVVASTAASNQNITEYVKKVMNFAEETIFYINASNLDSAKKSYSETLQAYESLNPEEKKLMHSRVNDLYTQLQALSSRPKVVNVESKLATKGLSNIIESIPEDLPELEPVAERGVPTITISSASKTSAASTPSVTSTAQASSTVSTASFVEEFGKSVASTSGSPNAAFFNTKDNVSGTIASNAVFNANANSDNSIIASALSSINADSDYDAAHESFAAEIDNDMLAANSGTENMLFTATSTDDSVEKTGKTEKAQKTSVKSVAQTKHAVSPISPPVDSITPIIAQVKPELKSESRFELKPIQSTPSQLIQSQPISSTPSTSSIQPLVDLNKKILGKIEPKTETKKLETKEEIGIGSIEKRIETKIGTKPDFKSDIKINDTKVVMPELKRPTNISAPIITQLAVPSQIDKLNTLLKRIDDDIIMEKFDKAKETYKEALLIYRPMRDSDKSKCYERFYATFKKLDDSLHQKSLHDILDKHLFESTQSNRQLASKKSNISGTTLEPNVSESLNSESSRIINATTLPVILANDLDTTRVYELIEESYFNIDNSHSDLAMLKYFKALESYHKLSISDKKKLYPDLYGLFKKLSITKKT